MSKNAIKKGKPFCYDFILTILLKISNDVSESDR